MLTDMENDTFRSYSWHQTSPETSKSPKISSSLWKQLSEEQDLSEIRFPTFTDTFTDDNDASSEYETNSNILPFPKSHEVWRSSSSFDINTDLNQLGLKTSWDPLRTNNQRSLNVNSMGSGLPSTIAHFDPIIDDIYREIEKESNVQSFTKDMRGKSGYDAFLDNRESFFTKDLLLPHQGRTNNNLWQNHSKELPLSSSPGNVYNNYSCGLSNPTSWEPVHSSVRPPLKDIGNLTNSLPSIPQKLDTRQMHGINTFPSNSSSQPFNLPTQECYYNQQASTHRIQPQKQHTDLIALMQELSVLTEGKNMNSNSTYSSTSLPQCTTQKSLVSNLSMPNKGCVFCKNNNYHSTFYKAHVLKDERGHCQCPVLRMYVCPLCSATGDYAHTLKYCPRNTVTRGDPISAGLPPGKVTNWREVANRMINRFDPNN